MPGIRLRPVTEEDLGPLTAARSEPADDPWSWFGFMPPNQLHRRFAAHGMISEEAGTLAVETPAGELAGTVGWHTVEYGPSTACRAFNIGITLFPAFRGRGYGPAAQLGLARYLFATTLAERVEATTDVDNVPEQRALEKAGFTREGVLRHAQFRNGQWRDMIIYSILRAEAAQA